MLVRHGANYGHHRSEMRRNDDGSLPIGAAAQKSRTRSWIVSNLPRPFDPRLRRLARKYVLC
jgi:hypothetical protein